MNRYIAPVIAIVVAAVVILISLSVYIVNQREQAIVTRFGAIVSTNSEPGLYFKVPFVDNVQLVEKRLLRYDLDDITVQVNDGRFYIVDAFLTYKITDLEAFRRSVLGSTNLAEQRIDTRFNTVLRDIYGKRSFEAALSVQRTEMMEEARDILRAELSDIGITVEDVRIVRTDLNPQVSQQTFDRMSAERLAEAALSRASGQEKAQAIRAAANREAISIVAEANRIAEILRGEGDAERNRIYAEAYSLDPNFFEFYRSLQAYRQSLANSDTSLVLTPDSEFFKFFGNAGQGVPLTPPEVAQQMVEQAAAEAAAAEAAALDATTIEDVGTDITMPADSVPANDNVAADAAGQDGATATPADDQGANATAAQ
ncbi:MAG: protease modulator HflC [Hyphomicrobiaceae bacterium]|nr:protease modulator HflC [Hyphomicrobiaceae bacterium]MCC0024848.1 protease modulator HflC [Hyphomicrobiaceae bacterium]